MFNNDFVIQNVLPQQSGSVVLEAVVTGEPHPSRRRQAELTSQQQHGPRRLPLNPDGRVRPKVAVTVFDQRPGALYQSRCLGVQADGLDVGVELMTIGPGRHTHRVEFGNDLVPAHRAEQRTVTYRAMSSSVVQLITAFIGITGTLVAAVITQVVARKSERERRVDDDRRRWDEECFSTARALLKDTERLKNLGCFGKPRDWAEDDVLRRSLTELRFDYLGYLPDEGIEGVITSDLVAEMRAYENLMDEILAQCSDHILTLSLLADPALKEAAENLSSTSSMIASYCISFNTKEIFSQDLNEYWKANKTFTKAVRSYLRRDLAAP